MDTSKIQLVFKENNKIEKIIEQSNLPTSYTLNDKIKAYLNSKASQIIKYHNPYLDFNINNINVNSNKNVFILDYLPRYVFMVAYTLSHINHPYLIYFNLDDKFINVLMPIGRDYQQSNTEDYINVINSILKINSQKTNSQKKTKTKTKHTSSNESNKENIKNKALLTAIYVLLDNTIKTRKYGIIYSKFSILTCENMTLCLHKITEISKMNIQEYEKQNLYIKIQDYYRTIGIELLQNYFYLLEKKEYGKANDFLQGGHNKFSEYYGKTRLNTFFKNNKSILGHLEVFISLYELLHMTVMKLNLLM
jgi:hypothetical protein